MIPNVHYDPTQSASQNPFYAAQRLFYAHAALTGEICQKYDVPGAFPGASAGANFTNYLHQPCRFDGTLTHPGCHFQNCNAQQGALGAGKRWEKHIYPNLIKLGWTKLKPEPGVFYIEDKHRHARLLCTTDDFLASSNSRTFLNFL